MKIFFFPPRFWVCEALIKWHIYFPNTWKLLADIVIICLCVTAHCTGAGTLRVWYGKCICTLVGWICHISNTIDMQNASLDFPFKIEMKKERQRHIPNTGICRSRWERSSPCGPPWTCLRHDGVWHSHICKQQSGIIYGIPIYGPSGKLDLRTSYDYTVLRMNPSDAESLLDFGILFKALKYVHADM